MKKLSINKKIVANLNVLDHLGNLIFDSKPLQTDKICGTWLDCGTRGCTKFTKRVCGTIDICYTTRICRPHDNIYKWWSIGCKNPISKIKCPTVEQCEIHDFEHPIQKTNIINR